AGIGPKRILKCPGRPGRPTRAGVRLSVPPRSRVMRRLLVVLPLLAVVAVRGDSPKEKPAREALKPLNLLVGSWKGSGSPEGTLEEKQKGHWQETVTWEWQFKDADAWLTVAFEKGKHFGRGELRYRP